MQNEIWAHPVSFAVDAAREAGRLAGAGIGTVRLAYVYHSGRWLLTTSRPGAVVDLPSGAWYPPGRFPAAGPRPVADAHPAPRAAGALAAEGIRTVAWLVGLHSTPLATAHPDLALRNVFGHRYRHALCPAQPAVREYAMSLAADVAQRPEVAGLDLEAFGYLGWQHEGAHGKAGPLRPVDRWLLSLCVCEACAGLLAGGGVNVAELTRRATTAVTAQLADPLPSSGDPDVDAAEVLGAELRDAVHRVRDRVVEDLAADLARAAGEVPVWLRGTANRYACAGKTAGDLGRLAGAAGRLMLTDFAGDREALRRELAAAQVADQIGPIAVGWSLLGQHTPDRATFEDLRTEVGSRPLALYAYDLAPAGRLGWLGRPSHDERSAPW